MIHVCMYVLLVYHIPTVSVLHPSFPILNRTVGANIQVMIYIENYKSSSVIIMTVIFALTVRFRIGKIR